MQNKVFLLQSCFINRRVGGFQFPWLVLIGRICQGSARLLAILKVRQKPISCILLKGSHILITELTTSNVIENFKCIGIHSVDTLSSYNLNPQKKTIDRIDFLLKLDAAAVLAS
mmetsp:Transcript_35750/g.60551  ORF Transcript_35750/g.60551 Transcript_35750/m.60551 type:complete len:114 (+) Transcript_35750:175-516(+)